MYEQQEVAITPTKTIPRFSIDETPKCSQQMGSKTSRLEKLNRPLGSEDQNRLPVHQGPKTNT